jgi:hypothetical protein
MVNPTIIHSNKSTQNICFLLKPSKLCSEVCMSVCCWSAVSKRGIYLVQSFFISSSSCKIYPTCFFLKGISSQQFHTHSAANYSLTYRALFQRFLVLLHFLDVLHVDLTQELYGQV